MPVPERQIARRAPGALARSAGSLALGARALLDLVLPEACAGCGQSGGAICEPCAAPLLGRPRLVWPDPSPAGLPPPWAVARYEDPVRSLIVAHKEYGARALGRPLGTALAASVAAACVGHDAPPEAVVLAPMPSRRAAVRARGRDPTLAMTRVAARLLRRAGLPCVVLPILGLRSGVRDQAGLDSAARAANLAGAVRLRRRARGLLAGPWAGAGVILVDDIVTTGASLCAAADLLRAYGVDVLAAALIAATPRRAALADPDHRPAGVTGGPGVSPARRWG